MRKRIMSLFLVFATLSLIATACGPQPALPTPASTSQPATNAPTATVAPTETLAPTATSVPTETPAPTATSLPTATTAPIIPTFTPLPEPVGYSYRDNFSDINSGWANWQDKTFGYMDGTYSIVINAKNTIEPVIPKGYLGTGDAIIEVDAWKEVGTNNGDFGFICGFKDYNNYFIMGISPDGAIGVYQHSGGEETTLQYQERKFTPADKYHLIANCQNSHYTLSVNGQTVIDLQDSLLTSAGSVGIYAGSFEAGAFIYFFDNFKAEQSGSTTDNPSSNVPEAPAALKGEIVFSDDFSTKSGNWNVSSTDDSGSAYENDTYKISIKTAKYAQWNLPRAFTGLGDATVEVDANLVSGPQKGDFGIVCGYKDNDNFHVLAIASDGYAEIVRWVNGDDDIFASKESAFKLADMYHLVASCAQGNLSLSVNGLEVLSAASENLDDAGGVGLFGGTFDEGNAVYSFDNFVVRKP